MKKLLATVFSILFLSAAFAISASAVGETLEANYGSPTVDGVIDDVWRTTQRQKLTYVIPGDNQKTKRATSTVYVSSLWDGKALYFLIEMIDNDFTTGGEGEYDNDTMYIYLDEADLFDKTWQEGQSQISLVPIEGSNAKLLHGEVGEGTEIVFGYFGDTGRLFEIKYVSPTTRMFRGQKILADFKYVDVTEEKERAHTLAWSDQLNEGDLDSSNWSYIVLKDGTSSGYDDAEDAATSLGKTIIEDYDFIEGTDGYGGEGADKLWDGKTSTKFCTSDFPQSSVAKLDGDYYINGFLMATANDTGNYGGRNPDDWKIEVSADNKNWVTLAEGDDSMLDEVSRMYFGKAIECDGNTYRYVRFTNEDCDDDVFQLSEIVLCGVKSTASKTQIDAVLNPKSNDITDESQINRINIVGAHDKIYSDSIADPTEPTAGTGNTSVTTTSALMTILVFTVFLVALCAVIVVLQSRKSKK